MSNYGKQRYGERSTVEELESAITFVNMPDKNLCDLLRCSPTALYQWRKGKRTVPLDIVRKIIDIANSIYNGYDTWRTEDYAINWYICMVGHVTTAVEPGNRARYQMPATIECKCTKVAYSMRYPRERPIPFCIPEPSLDYVGRSFRPINSAPLKWSRHND